MEKQDKRTHETTVSRRSVWAILAMGLTALVSGFLGATVLRFLSFPLKKHGSGQTQKDFIVDAGYAYEYDKGAFPKKTEVVVDGRRDAWLVENKSKAGSVWVRKDEEGTLHAFTSVCPHLGCSVQFEPKEKSFVCPCHDSLYDLSGKKMKGPAKRGLDSLEVVELDGRVKIKFQQFKLDVAQKEVV